MSRLDRLPPYLFSDIDAARRAAVAAGRDVIDLGIGDPDRPTPAPLVAALAEAAADPAHHRYPSGQGEAWFRRAVAGWLERRLGVSVDPDRHVLALIGSKEGLAHLPLALLEEGDAVLVPDVGYPVYANATLLAGGVPRRYPLRAEHGFRPRVEDVAAAVGERTRLVLVNSPHNPTGAVADAAFFRDLVAALRDGPAVLANDAAYQEVYFGERPPSLLQAADLERDRVIEFHSFSKLFNMTGWRVGFAVGHPEVVAALDRVKQNVDSGVFPAVQVAAAAGLGERFAELRREVIGVYPARRRRIVDALRRAGIEPLATDATFYVWSRVPGDGDAPAFCRHLLEEHALVVTPGDGFGPGGRGWFRISLTCPDDRLAVAAERLEGIRWTASA